MLSSSVYWKRESQMLSLITDVPSAIDNITPICDCISVGKPGYGKVFIIALLGLLLQDTLIASP